MSDARIHDLGYRAYDGPRAGLRGSMTSLGVHAIQRVLGLKRAARHKILPVVILIIAFAPALVYVGIATLLPEEFTSDAVPTFGEYYEVIVFAIFLFASFVAPEALCTDRRTGMMALYLASPLDRTTYVVSKVLAVTAVLLTITLFPQLFLLLAYTLTDIGPEGVSGFLEALGRILVSGVLVGVYYGALSSAISSITPRKGIASAAIVMAFLVPIFVTGALLDSTDIADEIGLVNIGFLPLRGALFILGENITSEDRGLEQVDGALGLAVTVGAAAIYFAFAWWRYQHIEVDR